MKKIRKLRGKAALEHEAWLESQNVLPWVNPISWIVVELRRRLYYLNHDAQSYFIDRHCYAPTERRLLDLFFVSNYDLHPEARVDFITRCRLIYLRHKYKKEAKISRDWVRVTTRTSNKKPVYVWHEDLEHYYAQQS